MSPDTSLSTDSTLFEDFNAHFLGGCDGGTGVLCGIVGICGKYGGIDGYDGYDGYCGISGGIDGGIDGGTGSSSNKLSTHFKHKSLFS